MAGAGLASHNVDEGYPAVMQDFKGRLERARHVASRLRRGMVHLTGADPAATRAPSLIHVMHLRVRASMPSASLACGRLTASLQRCCPRMWMPNSTRAPLVPSGLIGGQSQYLILGMHDLRFAPILLPPKSTKLAWSGIFDAIDC